MRRFEITEHPVGQCLVIPDVFTVSHLFPGLAQVLECSCELAHVDEVMAAVAEQHRVIGMLLKAGCQDLLSLVITREATGQYFGMCADQFHIRWVSGRGG